MSNVLPPWLPELPVKDVRITLNPHEAVLLWTLVHKSLQFHSDASDKSNSSALRILRDGLDSLEEKISDKLNFIQL